MTAATRRTAGGYIDEHKSDERHTGDPGRISTALMGALRLYQFARVGHTSPCRFTPTCSEFALEAIDRHGAKKGALLALRRLGRCRPGGPFGADPVPD